MTTKKPLNYFTWSLATYAAFLGVQMMIMLPVTLSGSQLSPYLGFFTWFAVSGGVGWGMLKKYEPDLRQILIVQALATFYMLATSIAVAMRLEAAFTLPLAFRTFSIAVAFWACGSLSIYLIRHFRSHPVSLV